MSGHSKFSNIKHKKQLNDRKKSELFVRISSQIMKACKQYNTTNLDFNPGLKNLIKSAQKAGMKKEKIKNILKRFEDNAKNLNDNIVYYGLYYQNYFYLLVVNHDVDKTDFLIRLKKHLKNFNYSLINNDAVLKLLKPSKYCLLDLTNNSSNENDDLLLGLIELGTADYYNYGNEYLELYFFSNITDQLNKLLKKFKNVKIIYLLTVCVHGIFRPIEKETYLNGVKLMKELSKLNEIKIVLPDYKFLNIKDFLIFHKF